MKYFYIMLSIFSVLNISPLSAFEHTHKHKHSYGIYKTIDELDKRKIVRKKSLDKQQLVVIAKEKVKMLVKDKKISQSWLNISSPEISKTKYTRINDYKVVFHNSKIKKKKYQNLYIFVNKFGEVQGANYSGK